MDRTLDADGTVHALRDPPDLQIGTEHLPDKQAARLDAKLTTGDPDREATLAWQCYQRLRDIQHARPGRGREPVTEVIETARRRARGIRNFPDYRLTCLLAAGGHRRCRANQTHHA